MTRQKTADSIANSSHELFAESMCCKVRNDIKAHVIANTAS